jgi:uncharacterized phage protein gp47/JayE
LISEKVLDEVLPVPGLEELKNEKIEELEKDGFVITNFASGGIFYHLLIIACQIRIELVQLLRTVLNNMFVSHAEGVWTELKAADFSKSRKEAVKTRGYVTLSRESKGEAVKIAKGYIFKTDRDINGEELRFFAVENAVLQKDALTGVVVVEAEKEGARYNVSSGQITKCLIHLDGIDKIENASGWIIREGADIEDYESLRSRTLGAWAELSTLPIRDKYKNVCEGVPGVLYVNVHDQHPRGQGTIDIIVTGTAGQATEGLLSEVMIAASAIRGPYDDIQVKSSVTVEQDISILLIVDANLNTDGLETKATSIIESFMQIQKGRNLYELNVADIIYALMKELPELRNIKVKTPAEDVQLDTDKVIVLGQVSVELQRV